MKKSEIFFGALRLPVDFLAIMTAFFVAYKIRPITDLIPGVEFQFYPELLPPLREYLEMAATYGFFLVLIFAINRLYSLKITESLTRQIGRILWLVSAWLMFIIAYYFLVLHQLFFSRIALAHIWLFTVILVSLGRFVVDGLQHFMLRYGFGKRRVLFVGVSDLADRLYEEMKENSRYQIIGALAEKNVSRPKEKLPVIGTLAQLEGLVKKHGVEEIIQAEPLTGQEGPADLLAFCRSKQIQYSLIPDTTGLSHSNMEIEIIGQAPLIRLRQTPLEGWGRVFKRVFDILASAALIALLIPLWILLPVLIKLDSKGPVIYASPRKYRDKTFRAYKFRSMVADAEKLKSALLEHNERSGPLFKIKNDPRVTPLGKFLRKTSLDELPQLFNVLKGDMSLVGPRPHLPEEVEKYEARHYEVFALKPGITGLSQISGRSNLDFEEEVRRDVFYIENWSLWFDVKLILKSVAIIFRADGH